MVISDIDGTITKLVDRDQADIDPTLWDTSLLQLAEIGRTLGLLASILTLPTMGTR